MPKVSIIIPNYNHALYLEQRIQSILNQSYQDFEVILLDDASSDHSIKVFDQFSRHPRIRKILRNSINTGIPFKQWNKGIAEAEGEYIWIAESDDYADKSLLEKLLQPLDTYPNIGVSYCQSWKVDEHNHIYSSMQNWTDDLDQERWSNNFTNSGLDECSQYLVRKSTIPNASAVVFRRSVYERVGGADESFRLSGDWMLWAKMLLVSDLAFTAEPLNFFRAHSNTVRGSSAKSALALQEAFLIIFHILQSVRVTADTQEDIFNGLMNCWLAGIADYHWDLATNAKVYRHFSKLDHQIHRRITHRLMKGLIKRVHPRLI